MVVNLDYDWQLITKPKPGRSTYTAAVSAGNVLCSHAKLTCLLQCYLLCRWLCLAAVISILIGFDVTSKVR